MSMNISDKIKASGHLKITTIDEKGQIKVVLDQHNTIQDAFLEWLNDKTQSNTAGDKSLNNLFTAYVTPPASGKDGVEIISGSTHYSMKASGTHLGFTLGWSGSGASRKLTSAFTGAAIVLDSTDDIIMGFNHNGSTAFATNFAKPDSLPATISINELSSMIIEWTITFADA